MLELIRFAAESWWNLFVTVVVISVIGGFGVTLAHAILRSVAMLAIKEAAKGRNELPKHSDKP